MDKLKELQDKRQSLAAKVKELADKQKSWSAEDRANWDALNADYDANQALLDAETTRVQAEDAEREKIAGRLASIEGHKDYTPKARGRIGRDGGSVLDGPANRGMFSPADGADTLSMAMQGWLRMGHSAHDVGELTDQHRQAMSLHGFNSEKEIRLSLNQNFADVRRSYFRNDLSSHGETAGGYTVGETFVARLEQAMLAYGGMMQVAEVIRTTTGEPMRWPTADDTGNAGVQLGESASISTSVDPTFAQVVWYAYKYSSTPILVPFELLRDNAVNLAEVLSNMLGVRLGRIQNTKYTTGSGAATAKGITVAAAAGVTAASQTAIAYDELIDLEHSLDPSRRNLPGVGYMFHDNTLKALRKLKDGEGRYLWQAGANSGAPDMLNNRPYTINQDMASAISSGAITVLFGELSAYKIRQVNAIRMYRLQERYRDTDQDGFIAFVEGDGNLLDAGDHPVKKLTQA